MEVYYCPVCSIRITDEDIKAGTAVRSADGRVICKKCLVSLTGAAHAQSPAGRATPSRAHKAPSKIQPTAPRNAPVRRDQTKTTILPIAIVVILVAAGAAAVMFLGNGNKEESKPKTAPPNVPTVAAKPPEKTAPIETKTAEAKALPDLTDPEERRKREEAETRNIRDESVARELAALKEWARYNADDPVTYKSLLSNIALGSSPSGEEARKIIAALPIQDPAKEVVWLSSLDIKKAAQSYASPMSDRSVGGATISIGGRKFAKGFGTHATSDLFVDLKGCAEAFYVAMGVDDEVAKAGSVEFIIVGDGQERFKTNVMRGGDPAQNIKVDVKGVHILELRVTEASDGGFCDHADWADARIVFKGQRPETIPVPTK